MLYLPQLFIYLDALWDMPTQKLGSAKIRLYIVPHPDYFYRALHQGIFLGNEDSLFDADKIDIFYSGRVGPETVDLDQMRGNTRTIHALERMLSRKNQAFFPGVDFIVCCADFL